MRTTDYGYDSCTPSVLSVAIPVRPLRTRLRYIYVYPFVTLVQISNNHSLRKAEDFAHPRTRGRACSNLPRSFHISVSHHTRLA
jgi:hypothetical protein